MSAVGRPRSLTPVKRAELCSLVSSGIDLEEAVGYVGCSPRTVRRHAERDDDFRRTLTQAQLASRLDPAHYLRKAAQTDWRAAAWLLERTDPDQFLPRDRANCSPQELTIVVDRIVEAALGQIDDQETRTRVYRHATSAARTAFNELFPAAVPKGPRLKRQIFPLSEHEVLCEMVSDLGGSLDPAQRRRDIAARTDSTGSAPRQQTASPAPTDTTPASPVKTPAPMDKTPAPLAKTPAPFCTAPSTQVPSNQPLTTPRAERTTAEFCPRPAARRRPGQNRRPAGAPTMIAAIHLSAQKERAARSFVPPRTLLHLRRRAAVHPAEEIAPQNRQQRNEHDADHHQLEVVLAPPGCCRSRSRRPGRCSPTACRPAR